jgi:hypothetical protein
MEQGWYRELSLVPLGDGAFFIFTDNERVIKNAPRRR